MMKVTVGDTWEEEVKIYVFFFVLLYNMKNNGFKVCIKKKKIRVNSEL